MKVRIVGILLLGIAAGGLAARAGTVTDRVPRVTAQSDSGTSGDVAVNTRPLPDPNQGRIPIFEPGIITESGSYYLARDLVGTTNPVLVIAAERVTLDLNGHSITGPADLPGDVVVMQNPAKWLRILNGSVSAGSQSNCFTGKATDSHISIEGVQFSCGYSAASVTGSADFAFVRNGVRADRNAISISGVFSTQIRDNLIGQIGDDPLVCGIRLTGVRGGMIANNTVHCDSYYGAGLDLDGGGTSSYGPGLVVQENSVVGCDTIDALFIGGGLHVTVRDNNFIGFRYALQVNTNGNRIVGNNVTYCMEGGSVSDGVSILGSDNVFSGNLIHGYLNPLSISGNANRIEDNSILGYLAGAGTRVSGSYNQLEANRIDGSTSTGGVGISLTSSSSNNIYRNNVLRGNPGGALVDEGTDNTDGGGNIP